MSLDYSIASIMTRLTDWSGFPKYQLERRVDIFLTPFLERFVSDQLKRPAVLVAPEFPLLSDLREKGARAGRQELSGRTVNADYLFHLPGDAPRWLFLELKTDAGSFEPEQADLYAIAKQRGMRELIEDLALVLERTEKRHKRKYEKLRSAVPSLGGADEPVLVAYLAPSELRTSAEDHEFPGSKAAGQVHGSTPLKTVDHFFSLESFAEQEFTRIPPEHQALWPYVRDFLRSIRTP
jgi:hypothetical protein